MMRTWSAEELFVRAYATAAVAVQGLLDKCATVEQLTRPPRRNAEAEDGQPIGEVLCPSDGGRCECDRTSQGCIAYHTVERFGGDPRLCGEHTGRASNRCLLPAGHSGAHDDDPQEPFCDSCEHPTAAELLRTGDDGESWCCPDCVTEALASEAEWQAVNNDAEEVSEPCQCEAHRSYRHFYDINDEPDGTPNPTEPGPSVSDIMSPGIRVYQRSTLDDVVAQLCQLTYFAEDIRNHLASTGVTVTTQSDNLAIRLARNVHASSAGHGTAEAGPAEVSGQPPEPPSAGRPTSELLDLSARALKLARTIPDPMGLLDGEWLDGLIGEFSDRADTFRLIETQ